VYGWGNPIFGDDGIGIEIAKLVEKEKLPPGVVVEWSSFSPFSVASRLIDFAKAILIDAWWDENKNDGEIVDLDADMDSTDVSMLTPHTANIVDVLRIYRAVYEDRFPDSVHLYGPCVKDLRIAEGVQSDHQKQIERVVSLVLDEIRRDESE
jgi:hydrogenase maturation protease